MEEELYCQQSIEQEMPKRCRDWLERGVKKEMACKKQEEECVPGRERGRLRQRKCAN